MPANGDYNTAANLDFTATFSEAVNVTGTPRIAITLTSGTVYANYLSGSGTNAIVFRYTVAGPDADADGITLISPVQLNGGTIKDLGGLAATLTYSVPVTTGITINQP